MPVRFATVAGLTIRKVSAGRYDVITEQGTRLGQVFTLQDEAGNYWRWTDGSEEKNRESLLWWNRVNRRDDAVHALFQHAQKRQPRLID
jgi:hypothetical protein